jgi:hypothetical protein
MIQFRLCASLLLLWSSSLLAAAENPADGDEELRAVALDLQAETCSIEDRLLGPPSRILSVYVGALPGPLSAASVMMTVDDQHLASHDITVPEARALAGDALYRVAQVRLNPGPHHIEVEIMARSTVDAAAAPSRLIAQLDYTKTPQASTLEVIADKTLLRWSPRIRMVPLPARTEPPSAAAKALSGIAALVQPADAGYTAGGEGDPVVRYARFLVTAHHYLEAAAQLKLLIGRSDPSSLDPAYYLASSETLTQYGLLAQAGGLLLQAASNSANAHGIQMARQDLASALYIRGDLQAAWDTLGEEPRASDSTSRTRWLDLACRILLAQGRLAEAARLLRTADTISDYDAYVRYYNLGVALVTSGDVGQGLTVLERLGSALSSSPKITALSDRANLAAGMHFLKLQQGATAIAILERMHSEGPYSSLGLLNLGWAWLAPSGTVQEKVMLGDERTLGPPPEAAAYDNYPKHDQNLYQRYDLGTFSKDNAKPSDESRRSHALALWTFLADHRSGEEEAQEAMLAIAVEQQKTHAFPEAIAWYERAIAALATSIAELHSASQYVESLALDTDLLAAPLSDTFDRGLAALPPLPTADYLADVLASRSFQSQLGELRDLLTIDRSMSAIQKVSDRLAQRSCSARDTPPPDAEPLACKEIEDLRPRIAVLRIQLASAESNQKAALRRQLLDDLMQQEKWRSKLLVKARFELARLYDSAPPP